MSLNENAPYPVHAQQQQQHQKYFKQPEFWPSSPHAWFGIVEAQFPIRQVTSEDDRFMLVASVLPENSASGEEEGRVPAALQRLSPPQPGDFRRQVSRTQHG